MADSTKGKNKKTLDAFADDLDAMLNMENSNAAQQVGVIEDDDAIDRLLMGNSFQPAEEEAENDEFADLDALIGDELEGSRKTAGEIDEFDDLIANIQAPGRQAELVVEEVDEFAGIDDETDLVQSIDEVTTPELTALERVTDIDEFADQSMDAGAAIQGFDAPDSLPVDTESMAEIDEFSDAFSKTPDNNADFLMADFDISADDDIAEPVKAEEPIDESEPADDAGFAPPPSPSPVPELVTVAETASIAARQPSAPEQPVMEDEFEEPAHADADAPAAGKTPPPVDHSAELAALAAQITVLKKQQQVFKQEMTEKAGKDELVNCLDELGGLQTEQKKTKRAVDAVGNQKPVAAYIANGLAVTALLLAAGLGFQGFIAKSQVGELVPVINKLQEQVNGTPAGNAADKEMLRKQLDELTVASSVAANQIAEINKALQGDSGSAKAGGDLGKQMAELSSQNMQMGSAIESLQSKVSALEKGRALAAAPIPKPEKKKPVAVEENWAVNLIAFKQDWYAKRKAEEFAGKGVPAKVSKTESKGENWYRLSVDGFKSQYEAAGYAAKVKKTLNLDSVWVTRNKD